MPPLLHHKYQASKYLQPVNPKWPWPQDLTIVTCKSYPEPSILEQSITLKTTGTVIPLITTPWYNTEKIKLLDTFLPTVKTPYLLYCDASDVVITEDPQKILTSFLSHGCEALFSGTSFYGGYPNMPEIATWVKTINKNKRYLNAGVFIGKVPFLKKLMTRALALVSPNPIPWSDYIKHGGESFTEGKLRSLLPTYPYGVPSDQTIFRYIEPEFYPDLKVDYECTICFRS